MFTSGKAAPGMLQQMRLQLLSQTAFLHPVVVWLSFFLVSFCLRLLETGAGALSCQSFLFCLLSACVYFFFYLMLASVSVWRLSLCWLTFPVFIFAIGWLRWYFALGFILALSFALYRSFFFQEKVGLEIGWSRFSGLLLLLVWVYFSGIGNHGNQSPDYAMHNGRLLDLVVEQWPVRYEQGFWVDSPSDGIRREYLVGYLAYYLPAALWGKLAGYEAAQTFLHFWALAGVWLALAWVWDLAGPGFLAAVFMVMFGGWDVVGFAWSKYLMMNNYSWEKYSALIMEFVRVAHLDTGNMDFWPGGILKGFFGNNLSIAAQVYWSPHQTVAAMVLAAMLFRVFLSGGAGHVFFVYALLAFWSPMNVMASAVIVLLFALFLIRSGPGLFFTFENLVATPLIVFFMASYYLAGSASGNPFDFLWNKTDFSVTWWAFLVFHFFTWGIYMLQVPFLGRHFSARERLFAVAVSAGFLLLSLFHYGQYNDLVCRGSAILMFSVFLVQMRMLGRCLQERRMIGASVIILLLVPGMVSGVQHLQRAWIHRDEQVLPARVVDYGDGWEFLGSGDAFFFRYLTQPPSR